MTLPVGSNRRGFTLVELILVLMLIGVSLLIVLPNINKGLQDREVRGSALSLAAVARDLRAKALMDGVPQQLVVYLVQQRYLAGRSREVQLPTDVKFSSVSGGEPVDRDVRKFYFFPNGSTLGGEIILADSASNSAYGVRVEPLTGKITVGRQ